MYEPGIILPELYPMVNCPEISKWELSMRTSFTVRVEVEVNVWVTLLTESVLLDTNTLFVPPVNVPLCVPERFNASI